MLVSPQSSFFFLLLSSRLSYASGMEYFGHEAAFAGGGEPPGH